MEEKYLEIQEQHFKNFAQILSFGFPVSIVRLKLLYQREINDLNESKLKITLALDERRRPLHFFHPWIPHTRGNFSARCEVPRLS